MQAVSDGPKAKTRDLGAIVGTTRDGLPRLIPRSDRERIRRGDVITLRLWLTLLSLYRIMQCPGKISTSTITDPGIEITATADRLFNTFLKVFRGWGNQYGVELWNVAHPMKDPMAGTEWPSYAPPALLDWKNPKDRKLPFAWLPIMNSGPNTPRGGCSLWTLWWDAKAIQAHYGSRFYSAFFDLAVYTGNRYIPRLVTSLAARPLEPFPREGLSRSRLSELKAAEQKAGKEFQLFPKGKLELGKIAMKLEAAGKVRLFAMETWWVQGLLYPLHKGIFGILRLIPQDGTHDQGKPLKLLQSYFEGCRDRGQKTYFASFDLKAATDRIPVGLQEKVLALLVGPRVALCWKILMVRKDYVFTPLSERTKARRWSEGSRKPLAPIRLRYAVGQPMGAYSSWAMLAITHHCLVQFAAWRAGHRKGWYPLYAVLGDDVVVVGRDVAREYQVVAEEFGIKIGLAKSLISENGSFEFAKRFYWKGADCSPLSAREFAVGLDNLASFVELARRAESLLPDLRIIDVIRSYGKGYRAAKLLNTKNSALKATRASHLLTALMSPGGPFESGWSVFSPVSSAVFPSEKFDEAKVTLRRVKDASRSICDQIVALARGVLAPYEKDKKAISRLFSKEGNVVEGQPHDWVDNPLDTVSIGRLRSQSELRSIAIRIERLGTMLLRVDRIRQVSHLIGILMPLWQVALDDVSGAPDPMDLRPGSARRVKSVLPRFVKLVGILLGRKRAKVPGSRKPVPVLLKRT
jgi:hypothetical protein